MAKKKDLRKTSNWPFKTEWVSNEKSVERRVKKMRELRPDARFRKQRSAGGMLFRIRGITRKK